MKLFVIRICLALVIVTPPAWCLGKEGGNAIHLLEVVEVKHPTVVLSDLLPPDAPLAIRTAAATVELCRAPQAGSMRILRAERILAAATQNLRNRIVVPSAVIIRSSGSPIGEAAVRDAISEYLRKRWSSASLPDRAKLSLPEFLSAREPSSGLQVTHMQWDVLRQAVAARLRCSNRESCGSFVAYIILPQPAEWPTNLVRTIAASSAAIPGMPLVGRVPLVTRGKKATLILQDATMRISLSVICLEPGMLNQRIRVIDRRSRRIFLADVIGNDLLHANL